MQVLAGYKTYIAAAGFLLLAASKFAGGDASAVQDLLAALGLFGLRSAVANQSA